MNLLRTREVLLTRYSEIFISRYFIIFDIDLIVATIAMQLVEVYKRI